MSVPSSRHKSHTLTLLLLCCVFYSRGSCVGEKCFIHEKHLLLRLRIRTKRKKKKKKKKKSDNEQPAEESTSETSGKREDGGGWREGERRRRTTGVVMCANT